MNEEAAQFNQLYIDFLRQYYLHKKVFLTDQQVLDDMPAFYKYGTLLSTGIQFLYRSGDLEVKGDDYKISQKAIDDMKYEKDKEEYYFDKLKVDLKNAKRQSRSYPYTQAAAWISFVAALFLGYLQLAQAIKLWPYHK